MELLYRGPTEARVIPVIRAIRDILLKEGLNDDSFPQKELVDKMTKSIEPDPDPFITRGFY